RGKQIAHLDQSKLNKDRTDHNLTHRRPPKGAIGSTHGESACRRAAWRRRGESCPSACLVGAFYAGGGTITPSSDKESWETVAYGGVVLTPGAETYGRPSIPPGYLGWHVLEDSRVIATPTRELSHNCIAKLRTLRGVHLTCSSRTN